MIRIEIDPNVRVAGQWTYSRIPQGAVPEVGEPAIAFESEDHVEWDAVVERVDRDLVYLSVAWADGRDMSSVTTLPWLADRQGADGSITGSGLRGIATEIERNAS